MMSGVQIRLKKMLRGDSLGSELAAYAYAGIISAGPLILSILGILLIGVLSLGIVNPPAQIVQFQVSVTYLISVSLVVTGAVQLLFTRFISDRLFHRELDRILPNFSGVVLLATVVCGVLGLVLTATLFTDETVAYRLLMTMGFVILGNIWIAVVFLAGLKRYSTILFAFLLGYLVTVVMAVTLSRFGLEGLMLGFVIGHTVLLACMAGAIHRDHEAASRRYMSFDMFDPRPAYPSLMLIGVFFNLGVWLDKFMFWFSSAGQHVIGPLRASVIYDLPIFISYLCIIPGMAIFLLRLETDFADSYASYYAAVREGGTLRQIRDMRDAMVRNARTSLYEILKIQSLVILLVFAFGDRLLAGIGISPLYLPLLRIDVVATSLQVLFLGCLTIFLYLDRRRVVVALTALFVVLNGVFTYITLMAGPHVYGYGFACALIVVVFIAAQLLNRCFERLEYETYMLQTG